MQKNFLKLQKKINIITLGCSKNTVDSEQFSAKLIENGFFVEHNSEILDHDIICINTCGFINDAKQESVDEILNAVQNKEKGAVKKVIVFGCLSQRYYEELKESIPEVDVFFGNYNLKELLSEISGIDSDNKTYNRKLDNPGHYAYLKIAEGCNRKCAFCAIPIIKGNYVSRDINEILSEARHLANSGVKELLVIAQDLSYYGYDINNQAMLPELVQELSLVPQIEWIRLHYLYPVLFPEELLKIIADNPKVCKYIDIPLQHISDNVLKNMRRGGSKKQIISLLDSIRKNIPDVAIRTTLLTGYPGETEADFNELLNFVKEQKFDRLGVFKYSDEENTYAANNFKDDVPEKIKQERLDAIMKTQQEISYNKNAEKVDKTFKVIIDKKIGNDYIGRTEFDSVEVDNDVIIQDSNLSIGNFYNVRVFDYDYYELYAKKTR